MSLRETGNRVIAVLIFAVGVVTLNIVLLIGGALFWWGTDLWVKHFLNKEKKTGGKKNGKTKTK